MESYQLIDQLSEQEPVKTVCRAFGIKRSSYYDYRHSKLKVNAEREWLKAKVNAAFQESRSAAGTRTIKGMLTEDGVVIGRFLAGRIMEELGLICKQLGPHRYKRATVEHIDIPNTLNREFDIEYPNQVWCGARQVLAGSTWLS